MKTENTLENKIILEKKIVKRRDAEKNERIRREIKIINQNGVSIITIILKKHSHILNEKKNETAMAANITHSLDAAILHNVIAKHPYIHLLPLHDSLGTCIADAPLTKIAYRIAVANFLN
jgi:DNA-directed RNA polymerase